MSENARESGPACTENADMSGVLETQNRTCQVSGTPLEMSTEQGEVYMLVKMLIRHSLKPAS